MRTSLRRLRSRDKERVIRETLARIPRSAPIDTGAGTGFPTGRLPSIAAPMQSMPGPRGSDSMVPGPPGNPGLPGAPGAAGAQGPAGLGVPGFDGKRGKDSFIPGPSGAQGNVGVAGSQGIPGPAGPPGAEVRLVMREPLMIPGARGDQGLQGIQGIQGPQGWMGPPGTELRILYREPLMVPGPRGDVGLTGSVGAQGPQGAALASMNWGRIIRIEPLVPCGRKLSGTKGFLLTGQGQEADPTFLSLITARLTADNAAIAAAVPTSVVAVTGLQQAIAVNEEWDIEWILELANSIAADVFVFNILTSAGTLGGRYSVLGASGVPTTGAAVPKFWQMPAGTITVANANAPGATGTIGLVTTVIIRARVKLTVAGGTVSVGVRAGTNAAASSGTATVKATSQMIANRIA